MTGNHSLRLARGEIPSLNDAAMPTTSVEIVDPIPSESQVQRIASP
ncbi:MAG: hypothetical protein ACK42H_19515 [Planctomycetota bacterium]